MRSNRSNLLPPPQRNYSTVQGMGEREREKLGHLHSVESKHTHVIHRHWLLLWWTTRSSIHIQEESFSTNKLTEMAFLLLKIHVEALCMKHVVLHPGVHRGPRLVYNERRLLCRPIFISFSI